MTGSHEVVGSIPISSTFFPIRYRVSLKLTFFTFYKSASDIIPAPVASNLKINLAYDDPHFIVTIQTPAAFVNRTFLYH